MAVPELTAQLSLRGLSWDMALIGFFVCALIIFGIAGGKRAVIGFVVAAYIGSAITYAATQIRIGDATLQDPMPGILFLVTTVFFTWFFSGTTLTMLFQFSSYAFTRFWQVLALSVLGTGFFISSLLHFLPGQVTLSAVTRTLFGTPVALFLWVLAPALFLIIMRPQEEDENDEEE